MSISCHLGRVSNVKIGVECHICVIDISFNCGQFLQFVAHSRYYKNALTQKRYFLVICTTFRSNFCVSWKNQNKHSTLNSSFNALSKWHDPHIKKQDFWPTINILKGNNITLKIQLLTNPQKLDMPLENAWENEVFKQLKLSKKCAPK